MKSELAEQVFALIEDRLGSRPTPMEFEMAYQARVAIDRIRFVIKHTEQFAPHTDQMRDASFQLLDALQRLETVDRRFQRRSQGAARGYDGRREIVDAATTHASVLRGVRPQVMSEEVSEDKAHEPGCPA